MINTVAIVGAGLMGRLLALSLHRQGYQVTLFDKDKKQAKNSAAYAAAGLLTPLGEAPQCEKNIVTMGFLSLQLWPEILAGLDKDVFFQQQGSLLISHDQDQGDYQRFARFIKSYYGEHQINMLDRSQLLALEPELNRSFNHAISLPEEGQIDNMQLLEALAYQLEKEQINWLSETLVTQIYQAGNNQQKNKYQLQYQPINTAEVDHITPKKPVKSPTFIADLIIDCRGIGAKKTKENSQSKPLTELRAVRGEVFKLYAPEVKLTRPIRLIHPRYQLYIAPKANGRFSVGATQVESEDSSPMTVRSAMELLSATYSVHSGFAEANILEQISQLRPAFNNNQPKISVDNNLIQVNGLFRHGYLISPVVLKQVVAVANNIATQQPYDQQLPYNDLISTSLTASCEQSPVYSKT